jgi:hypothetical protein
MSVLRFFWGMDWATLDKAAFGASVVVAASLAYALKASIVETG